MDLTNGSIAIEAFACLKCQARLEVRTQALCRSVVCAQCQAAHLYDAGSGKLSYKRKYRGAIAKRYLEIGDEGVLFRRRYVVVGWIAKKESSASYYWNEYYLFNPVHGFAQLSVYEGHWTFHEQLRVYPRETNINQTLIFQRNVYEPFNHYACTVLAAAGEFTHDIHDQQEAKVRELISPPYMLTREQSADELAWYLGTYVEPEEIRLAFNKTEKPAKRTGVGACQPMKLAIDKKVLTTVSIVFAVLLLLTMLVLRFADAPRTVFEQQFDIHGAGPTGVSTALESQSFALDRFRNSVELFARAEAVDNSWFELSGALINNATGEARSFVLNIEYYHGYEGGESWSEGKRNDGIVFSALPAGDYHLELYGVSDPGRPVRTFLVQVEQNVTLWSNFFVVLLLGLAFPLITWWRVSRFETARWGE